MSLDELYQEIILDHYRNPRQGEPCPDCRKLHLDNPVCGDELEVQVALEGQRIARVGFRGQGCAISQASASMMTEAVAGLSVDKALALGETVRRMMHGEPPAGDLGDLSALEGVARFPVRIKCALLAWTALGKLLIEGGGAADGGRS